MPTRISSKGQITIPMEIRKQVSLKAGDLLNIKTDEGKIILFHYQEEKDCTAQAAAIIKETAGIWNSLEEDGAEYVRRLRKIPI